VPGVSWFAWEIPFREDGGVAGIAAGTAALNTDRIEPCRGLDVELGLIIGGHQSVRRNPGAHHVILLLLVLLILFIFLLFILILLFRRGLLASP
jgi:hypothetical protein